MLTKVNFSCGHTADVNLSNDPEKRKAKIAELEISGLCPQCRKAVFEKEDKENDKKFYCVRMKDETKKKKYSDCPVRQTGYPKEKGYSYVFIPVKSVCAEAVNKMIKNDNITLPEAIAQIEEEFKRLYPDKGVVLKPIAVEEDDIFAESNNDTEMSFEKEMTDPEPAKNTAGTQVQEKVINKNDEYVPAHAASPYVPKTRQEHIKNETDKFVNKLNEIDTVAPLSNDFNIDEYLKEKEAEPIAGASAAPVAPAKEEGFKIDSSSLSDDPYDDFMSNFDVNKMMDSIEKEADKPAKPAAKPASDNNDSDAEIPFNPNGANFDDITGEVDLSDLDIDALLDSVDPFAD